MICTTDWSGRWRRAMRKNVWTGAIQYGGTGGPQPRRTSHDTDRSIFTTSNLPRHVLSTHCNAVAVDAAVDKRHTLAIQGLKQSVEGRRTRPRVEGRPVIPETVEKAFHRFLRSQSEAKNVSVANDHVHGLQ